MATTQAKAAAPKKSQGFQGVQAAIWIIVFCFIAAVLFYMYVLGNPANFKEGDTANEPASRNLEVPSGKTRSFSGSFVSKPARAL